jgi:hypothetical protein
MAVPTFNVRGCSYSRRNYDLDRFFTRSLAVTPHLVTISQIRLTPDKFALPSICPASFRDLSAIGVNQMRERDRICNERLVSRDGCVEKELDFTSIAEVASQRPRHFALIAGP